MSEDKFIRRWNDKAQLIVAGLIIGTALLGWLHSAWSNGTRMDNLEKQETRETTLNDDHEKRLIVLERDIHYIVKGIDELRRR